MDIHVLPECIGEKRPIDPLGRAIGRHRHRPQAERGISRRFVPDQRHLPVQHCRSRAKRLLTNRRDELANHLVIDVLGRESTGACIAREAGEADVGSPARKPREQINPGGAQR